MPTLSRYYIRVGLIYLVVGLLVGFILSAAVWLNLPPSVAALRPTYLHLLTVGWLTQMIFGVAYWMFPKASKESPRGSARLGWAIFILLNAGLLLRVIGEPLLVLRADLGLGGLMPLAALAQWLAVCGFIIMTWPRIKER